MSSAMQNSDSASSNITLAQINEMLNGAGFPIINPQRVQALQQIAPRERIIRAIRMAKTDNGARAFLTNLFEQAGITLSANIPQQEQRQQPSAEPHESSAGAGIDDHASGYDDPNSYRDYHETSNVPQSENQRLAPEDRMSVHVYGGKAALCFEADITKAGVPTVALDAANATGPRSYDWSRKVRLQMTRAELPVVAAVLMGVIPKCEFKNHGQDNTKGFGIERQQGGKVYIKVFAKNEGVRGVPVMAPDVFYVTSLVVRQIQKANPWLDGASLMALIQSTQYQG